MKKDTRVHIVGSIPLETANEVFDLLGYYISGTCTRIPDGETGIRSNWIGWQHTHFANQDEFIQNETKERTYQLKAPFRFRNNIKELDLHFGNLGFAEEAIKSYRLFCKKKDSGLFSNDTRFMVALPTPFAPVYSFMTYEFQEKTYPAYEEAMMSEVDHIVESINSNDLSIQWDVATELSILEKVYPSPIEDTWNVLLNRLAKLGDHVPIDVDMGYHLCYGSMNNLHWKEPDDLSMCVNVANEINRLLNRQFNFIHMPVPINRRDAQYFEPLQNLSLEKNTEVYLGLVHENDTLEGNLARISTASKYLQDLGISTECGMGRRKPDTIPHLLRLHADLASS